MTPEANPVAATPPAAQPPPALSLRWRGWLSLLVGVVALLGFAPGIQAGFHIEDFNYLALMRHLDSAWPLLHENLFFVYYYRPTGLMFWWASLQLAGTNPLLHNLLDLALQCGNAMLLALLAQRLGRNTVAALIAGLAFACLPASSATAMWLSDRYDPLALWFGLLALLMFESALDGRRRAAAWTALWLMLALGAKEVAFVIPLLMLVRLGWRRLSGTSVSAWLVAAVLAPVVTALLLRSLFVTPAKAQFRLGPLLESIITALAAWWTRFPEALWGFRTPPNGLLWIAAMIGVVMLLALLRATWKREQHVVRLAITGAALLLSPALVQWPITAQVLVQPESLHYTVNLRFFHLAMAGLAVLIAASWLALPERSVRIVFSLALLVLGGSWFAAARDNAHDWRVSTAASTRQYLMLGHELGQRAFPARCRIHLHGDQLPPQFAPFADVIAKTNAAPGASLLGCTVQAGKPPFVVLLRDGLCTAEQWPGLKLLKFDGRASARFGNLCGLFPFADDADSSAASFHFEVDADGHLSELSGPQTAIGH
ncbi:MAG: hypothetical protein ABIY56_05750 [Dokdonella sp.]